MSELQLSEFDRKCKCASLSTSLAKQLNYSVNDFLTVYQFVFVFTSLFD